MIRTESYPFGIQYRCDTCGCHVGKGHVEGSEACHTAWEERISSQS